jgi:hypothetical protein
VALHAGRQHRTLLLLLLLLLLLKWRVACPRYESCATATVAAAADQAFAHACTSEPDTSSTTTATARSPQALCMRTCRCCQAHATPHTPVYITLHAATSIISIATLLATITAPTAGTL